MQQQTLSICGTCTKNVSNKCMDRGLLYPNAITCQFYKQHDLDKKVHGTNVIPIVSTPVKKVEHKPKTTQKEFKVFFDKKKTKLFSYAYLP